MKKRRTRKAKERHAARAAKQGGHDSRADSGHDGSAALIEVEQEADGRWLAEVPVVPGALAYGATREAAVAAAEALAVEIRRGRTEQADSGHTSAAAATSDDARGQGSATESGQTRPAARIGPRMRKRMKLQDDGTEVEVVEVLQYFVERRETTFGFKHPKLSFAMFGKTRTNREGPFASWSEAREATVGDPGHVLSEWSEPKRVGSIQQAQGGMVALVAAGSVAGAAVAAELAARRPELLVITDEEEVAAALAPPLPEKLGE